MMRIIFCLVWLLAASTIAAAEVEYIQGEASKPLGLPFSDAVRVDDVLILSGQVGATPGDFKLVEGGIVAETHQIFRNMKTILEDNNSSVAHIFKCTVMIDDIGLWPKFNEIYVTYFPGKKPARSAFGADGLALGAAIELECWAAVK